MTLLPIVCDRIHVINFSAGQTGRSFYLIIYDYITKDTDSYYLLILKRRIKNISPPAPRGTKRKTGGVAGLRRNKGQ